MLLFMFVLLFSQLHRFFALTSRTDIRKRKKISKIEWTRVRKPTSRRWKCWLRRTPPCLCEETMVLRRTKNDSLIGLAVLQLMELLDAVTRVKRCEDSKDTDSLLLIAKHRLHWGHIPHSLLRSCEVGDVIWGILFVVLQMVNIVL